jgi:hypothetical protein
VLKETQKMREENALTPLHAGTYEVTFPCPERKSGVILIWKEAFSPRASNTCFSRCSLVSLNNKLVYCETAEGLPVQNSLSAYHINMFIVWE